MFLFIVASGLSLIFGVLRVLNFAHGSFYMIGAYVAWQITSWLSVVSGSFWLAVLGSAITVALLGGIIERLLLRHLLDGREDLYQLLFTYALVLIFGDAVKTLWGTQQLGVQRPAIFCGRLRGLCTAISALQPFHHSARSADRTRLLAPPQPYRHGPHDPGGGL